jgi:serine/threonine-protein kinase
MGAPQPEHKMSETRLVQADPLIGVLLLGRVRIDRPLARGAMGKVYVGEQVSIRRPCAVKVLDPAMSGDLADFTRRFLLEASVAAKLTHPNVVTIFDYGQMADGGCFIAMEYLDGRSLYQELKALGRLPVSRAVHIALQVARGLREAHALGVVHRDVKPGNIHLVKRDDDDDFVKVLDFGIVKDIGVAEETEGEEHTKLGTIMGSPRYMAPEQVQGKRVDARTDVYALGAMLYTMLAGRPPFDKPTELAVLMAQVSEMPQPIASVAPGVVVPAGLEVIVMKCLAKDPDARFTSMADLIGALKGLPDTTVQTFEVGAGTSARHPTPVRSSTPGKWRRYAVPLMLAGTIACIALFQMALLSRGRGPEADLVGAHGGLAPALAPASSLLPELASAPAGPVAVSVPTGTLHVDTIPSGAKVKEEGDTKCESTPCDIVYSGAQADPTYEHLLTLTKADYKVERKLVKLGASPLNVRMSPAR